MARGKGVTKLLLDSSLAAMLAGIEIHNKPNIAYRYPTANILIINAWELALKAYVYKYIGKKRIYDDDGVHTIAITKANELVKNDITKTDKNYLSVYENIRELNEYRCSHVHFANSSLDPIIFMLMGKAVLNYNEFIKKYFNKDITSSDDLIMLPIGFKLPFNPIDYLKQDYGESQNEFVNDVINTIRTLKEENVTDSIVVGFNLFTASVKKIDNSDIVAAIDQIEGTVKLQRTYRITDDPTAPAVRMTPDLPPLRYYSLREKIKAKAPSLKFDNKFNRIMRSIKNNPKYCITNYADPINKSVARVDFYTEATIDYVIEQYFSE